MAKWLRINYPLIWRTRIHWMLPTLIVINLSAFYFAKIQIFFPHDLLTIADVAERVLAANTLLLVLFCFWGYRQLQWPLREFNFSNATITALIYFFMLAVGQMATLIYPNQLVKQMALAMGDRELVADVRVMRANNFWLCSYSQANQDPELRSYLDKYGFMDIFPRYYTSSMSEAYQVWLSKHCDRAYDYEGEYTGFTDSSGKEPEFGLKERVDSLVAAKQMREKRGIYYERYALDHYGNWLLYLLQALVLLIVFSAINMERIARRFRVNWDWLVQFAAYPLKCVKPVDHWLVSHFPKTWALGNSQRLVILLMAVLLTALIMPLAQQLPDFDEKGEAFFFIFALPIWALANTMLVQRHGYLSFRGENFLEHLWAILRIVACQMVFGLLCYALLNYHKEMSDSNSREFIIITLFISVVFTVPVYISHYLRWSGVVVSALGFGLAVVLLIVLEQLKIREEIVPLSLWLGLLSAAHIYNLRCRSMPSILLLAGAVGGAILPFALFWVELFDDLNLPTSRYDEEFGFIVALSVQVVLASFFALALSRYVTEPHKLK